MIAEAREAGVECLEINGAKYYLKTDKKALMAASVEEMKPEDIVKPMSILDEYTDEEIQYFATPFFDELMAKKEAQTKQKLEDNQLRGELNG